VLVVVLKYFGFFQQGIEPLVRQVLG